MPAEVITRVEMMVEDKNVNLLVFGDRRNGDDEGDAMSLPAEESEDEEG